MEADHGHTKAGAADSGSTADPRAGLAIQRTELPLERMQLGWVRTIFALITAGLALDKGTQALHDANMLRGTNWVEGGHVIGTILAASGTLIMIPTTLRYVRQARSLARLKGIAPPRIPPSLPVSLLVLGLAAALTGLLLAWG